MSADNRICIMQAWDGQWAVWNGSASRLYHQPPESASMVPSESAAIKRAKEMERSLAVVEYGIQVISREEQEQALVEELKDLNERLVRLRATGRQFIPRRGMAT